MCSACDDDDAGGWTCKEQADQEEGMADVADGEHLFDA